MIHVQHLNFFFFLQVTFYHLLKLFQTESALASGKKQLVSEFYDEIVSERSCYMYQQTLLMLKSLFIAII